MIHPHTTLKYINKEMGHGVVATEFIPAGTITWVLDKLDREFTLEEFKNMEPIYQEILDTYTYRNNLGNLVLCWDNGKYVNHSFNSNCLTTAYDFEIAIRDIHKGEQLTDDYGYLNIFEPFKGIDEGTKRKVAYPNDLLHYHTIWDEKLESVFDKITSLDQPLRPFVPKDIWTKVKRIIQGEIQMDSILSNYYDDNAK